MKAYGSTGIQHNPSGHSMSSYALLKDHSRAAIRPQFMWNEIDCRTSPHAQNIAHWVALSTGLWLKVCISMPRKHDDSGIPRRPMHEVPSYIATSWNRYLARDPPSYDSGIPLSEADAKTMMDKIEARTKWLKANGKAPSCLGKHQRAILARAKFKADDDSGIPRQEALMRAGCIN